MTERTATTAGTKPRPDLTIAKPILNTQLLARNALAQLPQHRMAHFDKCGKTIISANSVAVGDTNRQASVTLIVPTLVEDPQLKPQSVITQIGSNNTPSQLVTASTNTRKWAS